jgi:hypothetical protein
LSSKLVLLELLPLTNQRVADNSQTSQHWLTSL